MKSSLQEHYDAMYRMAWPQIQGGHCQTDTLLDARPEDDTRRGMSLLMRPSSKVKHSIQRVLDALREEAPEQYYYPASDIHVTVLSLITCRSGFQLSEISVAEYVDLIAPVLQGGRDWSDCLIHFQGVTVSPSCVMVQGFPNGSWSNEIRDQLRERFRKSSLQQTLDARYCIQTAHSTVVRFRQPLLQAQAFASVLESYRDFEFGTFDVKEMELVLNDWYQRAQQTQVLHRFELDINGSKL